MSSMAALVMTRWWRRLLLKGTANPFLRGGTHALSNHLDFGTIECRLQIVRHPRQQRRRKIEEAGVHAANNHWILICTHMWLCSPIEH